MGQKGYLQPFIFTQYACGPMFYMKWAIIWTQTTVSDTEFEPVTILKVE